MSLRQIAIGSMSMTSVTVLRMMLQLFILPVLARYLTPEDYGLIAIAMPFVLFAMMFSDAGMTNSLIRESEQKPDEWSTCFWLMVFLGFVLSILITLTGYIISLFLDEPALFSIIAWLSLIIILQTFVTVPGAGLQQTHRFTTLAGIEIAAMFVSLCATFAAAIYGWGAWALVAQQIVHYCVKFIMTWIFAKFRPHFIFKMALIKEHLIFGRDMLGNNFLMFIRDSGRNMVMGKILGTGPVGVFTMASLFSDLPRRVASGPLQMVLYPRIAALRRSPETVKTLFIAVTRVIAILIVPGIGMLAVAHEPVFTIVLSEKWDMAGRIFMLLAPGAIAQSVTALKFTIAMAYGKTSIIMRQALESCVLYLVALIVAVPFGLEWVAFALSIAMVVYIPRSLSMIFPLVDLNMKRYVASFSMPLLVTAVAIGVYELTANTIILSDWMKFGLAFILGILALVTSMVLQLRTLQKETTFLKQALSSTEGVSLPETIVNDPDPDLQSL